MKLCYNDETCPYCGELTDHYHGKVCGKCTLARQREYYQQHRKKIVDRAKEYQKVHVTECSAYSKKYKKAHKEVIRERQKAYYKANKEAILEQKRGYKKAHKEKLNEYRESQLNSNGSTLNNIRNKSRYYLFDQLKHTKIDGYEIHHCWGYDDHTKFIFVPKELHLKIHQYLRDNNIDAKAEHYTEIVQLINECNEYTYIHV